MVIALWQRAVHILLRRHVSVYEGQAGSIRQFSESGTARKQPDVFTVALSESEEE